MNIPHQYQLFTSAQSQELDTRTISDFGIDGFTLMEIAGSRASDVILEYIEPNAHGLIVCGTGNNAGDALVVARNLAELGYPISVLFVKGTSRLSPDCQKNYELLKETGQPLTFYSSVQELPQGTFDFVVDGLLGTGLNAEVRSPYKEVVAWINTHSPLTFAMDIPTGLSADTGEILGTAVHADVTITFGVLKLGFFLNSGYDITGNIVLCNLPFPAKFKTSTRYLIQKEWLHDCAPTVPVRRHKYDGGVVYIIAGSEGLTGAGIMAAKSAWATGVGAVVLITPLGLLPIYEKQLPEIIKKPIGLSDETHFSPNHLPSVRSVLHEKPGVLLIGPGLGRHKESIDFVRGLLSEFEGKAVIDADALFALDGAFISNKPKAAEWILTPHPGELKALLSEPISSDIDRLQKVQEFSVATFTTILSKGLPSCISSTRGDIFMTSYDTRIFSRAGFGDILAGKVAGYWLLKQSAELAGSFALLDGKTKADRVLSTREKPLEPIDII